MKVHQLNGVCIELLFVGLFIISILGDDVAICPLKCSCTRPSHTKSYSDRIKAKCGGGDSVISYVEELDIVLLRNGSEITNLDLSGNNLTYLPTKSFALPNLQKLDLNKNKIEQIDDGAFTGLSSLKRLDLSSNKIRILTRAMFDGLVSLERLKVSQNFIRQIKEGTFDGLETLKQLDVSGNPLVCDCDLWWITGWGVKLAPVAKCDGPGALRGQPLRKLRPNSCPWPYDTFSPLELVPQHDQVVFEGDSLRLDCRAGGYSLTDDSTVTWYWAGLPPQSIFSTVRVKNKTLSDTGLLESTLIIDELRANHTGEWNCELVSSEGNHSSTVSIIVISDTTKYCQPIVTRDNKGEYWWPKTVAGHEVGLPCRSEIGIGMARHNCSLEGRWLGLNTSVCPYISETTRILQQYARMNLSAGRANVVESAKRLHNYTLENKAHLTDAMDIVYITQTISNYLEFVEKEKELGALLLDLVSHTMELDGSLLSMAQREDRSCSKLLDAVETVTQFTPSIQSSYQPNMAVGEFRVSRDSFLGMTCTWWNSPEGRPGDRLFLCSTSNKTAGLVPHDKVLEASIQIPASLLHQLEGWGKPSGGSHQLILSLYENAKLFPPPQNTTVSSSVVGTKLVGIDVGLELSDPVIVTLGGASGGRLVPAWWDPVAARWTPGPCQPSHLLSHLLILHCKHLGYFTLLQKPPHRIKIEQSPSRLSSPGIYVGTFVGSTCLLVSTFTYAFCHTAIQMSTRLKHALANSWASISLLSILFSVGIYQTEDLRICRAVGLLVHYLTLCVLFWMAISINGLHRAVRRPEPSVVGSESEGGGGGGGGPRRMGLYLLGWGVPALLVGLSGAVNPGGYATPTHCSLGPGPAFTPVLVPVSALLVFILTRSLMVRSAAGEKDSNAQLSEGTQATDLELLETGALGGGGGVGSVDSVATPSSHVDDPEHPPSVQLRAFLLSLGLYSATWASASLSVLTPLGLVHEETAFAVLYALFLIALGAFVVFFYCFSRSDVRNVWFTLKPLIRSRNVQDSHPAPPPLVSSRNSVTSGSIGPKSVRPEPQGETAAKVNLVDLHRRQYHSNNSVITNAADSFYNPHQSVVARKFFKRQRRKRHGLGTRRCGDGAQPGDTSELFQVGGVIVGNQQGPLERLVIGAEEPPPPHQCCHDSSAKYYASVASECCSCVVSEVHSTTDCTRDLTSEHSSRSSHLYATVAPDPPLTMDAKTEAVRVRLGPPSPEDEDKKETSV